MAKGLLAIIGTAGRGNDAARLDAATYRAMLAETCRTAEGWGMDSAVSGMAPWADHLAVRAYLDGALSRLVLFAPAKWDGRTFVSDRKVRHNPGQRLNELHAGFSGRAGFDSLGEIRDAVLKGAEISVFPGFDRRNLEVAAAATRMLAFTYGSGEATSDCMPHDPGFSDAGEAGLKDGSGRGATGTAGTWRNAWRCEAKRHVNLFLLPPLDASVPRGP